MIEAVPENLEGGCAMRASRGNSARRTALSVVVLGIVIATVTGAAAQPLNDNFFDATVVSPPLPFSETIDTSDATAAASDPSCIVEQGATVWYVFTPEEDLRLEANTFGSNYDTVLSVWVQGPRRLQQVGCTDDTFGQGLQSRLRFDAAAGVNYFFMIGSFGGNPGGSLTFNLLEAPPIGPPPEVTIAVDPVGRVRRDGTAVISGTLTCSAPVFASLDIFARQTIKRPVVDGFGFTQFECAGVAPWEVVVFPNAGAFGPGAVTVSAFSFACDADEQCTQSETTASVVLQSG